MIEVSNNDKKKLFLRICYRKKSKLRSFECFPSFKALTDEIIKIYPAINDNTKEESNKWRLETDESDWIESETDWDIITHYVQQNKQSNPIYFTLYVIIIGKDEADNSVNNLKLASFQKCYKNSLTLLHQRYILSSSPTRTSYAKSHIRPPPPPYQPTTPSYYAPYAAPPYNPYYAYPPYPQPYQQPQPAAPPFVQPPIPMKQSMEPPIKRRRFSDHPPTIAANAANAPPAVSAIPSTTPSLLPMPSGPPPAELLNANPFGIVHKDGYVWCEACNRWFEIHCFDSHLLVNFVINLSYFLVICYTVPYRQGKKHKKNIEAFSFRKVLKHWQNIRTKVEDKQSCNIEQLSVDDNLWYAQICLSCLSEVHYSSWRQHVNGSVHQNNFRKSPRTVVVKRKLPPGNEESNEIPTLFAEKYFGQISNYVPGSKILVLGEQDFSYSLGMQLIVCML